MSKIYLKPVGGLCNRIRAIDSLLSVASECQKQLVVIWERDSSLNCSFSDLFQFNSAFQLIETKPILGWSWPFFPSRLPSKFLKQALYQRTRKKFSIDSEIFFNELGTRLDSLRPINPEKFADIHVFDRQTYDQFVDFQNTVAEDSNCFITTCWRICDHPKYSERFQPSNWVDTEVKKTTSGFNEHTYGIHIRGTDAEMAKKYSSVEAFKQQMDLLIEQSADTSFFLATDEPAIKNDLLAQYKNRIRVFDQPDYSRDSPENIKNALVDLLCLSETKEIFGSYFSTFSQLAAQWKGINETTIFRDGIGVTS